MYTKEEIDQVLKIYDKLGSVRGTVRALGYPSRNLLRRWVNERKEFGKLTVKTNSRGDGRVSKDHAPIAQRTITRYQYALGFVPSADKLEEQMRGISTPCGFDSLAAPRRISPGITHALPVLPVGST